MLPVVILSAALSAPVSAAPADVKPLLGAWSANFTCGEEKGTARLTLKPGKEPGTLAVEYSSKIRIPGRMRYMQGRVSAKAARGEKPGQHRFEVRRHEYNPIVDTITGTASVSGDLKTVTAVTEHWPGLERGRWGFSGKVSLQTGLRTAVYSYEYKTQGGSKSCAGSWVKQ